MPRMEKMYAEGISYVVCDGCKSHIMIDERICEIVDEGESAVLEFACDWWPCQTEFSALVTHPAPAADPPPA